MEGSKCRIPNKFAKIFGCLVVLTATLDMKHLNLVLIVIKSLAARFSTSIDSSSLDLGVVSVGTYLGF